MKEYILYFQGKILEEFKAENYKKAKEKIFDIVSLEEVEE